MRLYFKVVESSVWWKNPRNEEWDVVTNFGTPEAAAAAAQHFSNYDFQGWESVKLSKSNMSQP